jgi:hypothetical protein
MTSSVSWSLKAFVVATICALLAGFKAELVGLQSNAVIYASGIISFVAGMGACAALRLFRGEPT